MRFYTVDAGTPTRIDVDAERLASTNNLYVTPSGTGMFFGSFRNTDWTYAQWIDLGIYKEEVLPIDGVAAGPDTLVEGGGALTVLADRVTRTSGTRRAMTQPELDARDDDIVTGETTETTEEMLFLAFNAIIYLAKNPHNAALDVGQIFTALQNPTNQEIDRAAFFAKKKELRFPA